MSVQTFGHPVLVGDIGGTNARFGVMDGSVSRPVVSAISSLPVAGYPGLAEAIADYLQRIGLEGLKLEASLAIAGPVEGQTLRLVNGGWVFDRERILAEANLKSVLLMNDFSAQALAMGVLADDGFQPQSLVPVKSGVRRAERNHLVMGPGTGLGVAGLVNHAGEWLALPGEGGHVSFGPTDDLDDVILMYFRRLFPRVSVERIVSGSGLETLYLAVGYYEGLPTLPLRAAEISCQALAEPDSLARRAWERFLYIIGSVAADQALTLGACGGVFLCGGILPRMQHLVREGEFERGFLNKGRYQEYLEAIPVHLCVAHEPGLQGAALAWKQSQNRTSASVLIS